MRVLVTGAKGFIGKNLILRLSERNDVDIVTFTREDNLNSLDKVISETDCIFHLAGINRPNDVKEFDIGNNQLTQYICDSIFRSGKDIPIIYTSSIQADIDNEYGISKRKAEQALFELKFKHAISVYIYRLPNVFGKWARPNYNSVVATFCHNIARDIPIQINNPSSLVRLVYVDDVVDEFMSVMDGNLTSEVDLKVEPEYSISLGELANQITSFKDSRANLISEKVGTGLTRALYSTYVSYLDPDDFIYEVPKYGDDRGVFVEMLKTKDAGQFSFFTAHPGITRGGHYHHTKTEKFLVIKGKACFRFRHMITGELYELFTADDKAEIVETVPGWTHDVTNVGDDDLICMLWANEIFDRDKPDTIASHVSTEA